MKYKSGTAVCGYSNISLKAQPSAIKYPNVEVVLNCILFDFFKLDVAFDLSGHIAGGRRGQNGHFL